VDAWLQQARDALADVAGVDAARLDLDDETVRELLDLARIAAHDSSERTNAPLLCFLLGRASASADLAPLLDAVRTMP